MQGVDAACQTYFDEYVATYGHAPQHNVFVTAAQALGVSRTKARKDYQMLRGPTSRTPDQEASVDVPQESLSQESLTREGSAAPPWAQAVLAETQTLREQVATLTLRDQARERTVQELRALVQVLTPRPSNGETREGVQALGRALADLALLTTRVQTLADQQTRLAQTVAALDTRLQPWGTIEGLARTDPDVRQALESLLQIASPSTKGTLHTAVAEALGWPRPTKYIRQ